MRSEEPLACTETFGVLLDVGAIKMSIMPGILEFRSGSDPLRAMLYNPNTLRLWFQHRGVQYEVERGHLSHIVEYLMTGTVPAVACRI